jgi:hypothetical protein
LLAAYAVLEQNTPPFDPQGQVQRRQQAEAAILRRIPFWLRSWTRHTPHCTQAMQRIPDGATIALDGGAGTLQLSEFTPPLLNSSLQILLSILDITLLIYI